MSYAAKSRFSLGIDIETGVNDVIIINDGSDRTCTVAPGRYFVTGDGSSDDLLSAVEYALNASASALTFTVALVANTGSTRGFTVTTGSGSFYFKWASASSTFYRYALGYSAASNTANAATQTSPYSSGMLWYPEQYGDVRLFRTDNVTTWQESLAGVVDSHKLATRYHADAVFDFVARDLVNAAEADYLTHPTLDLFRAVVAGSSSGSAGAPSGSDFWWTPDVDSTTGYQVVIRDPAWGRDFDAAAEEQAIGLQTYRVKFPMRAYVTITA